MTVAQIIAAFQAQFQTFLTSLLAAWEAEQNPEPQPPVEPEPQPEVETVAPSSVIDTSEGVIKVDGVLTLGDWLG